MQVIINQLTKEIICTALGKGSRHDFIGYQKAKLLPENKYSFEVTKVIKGFTITI